MVDFGVRLKELRKENGMTQRQLAERLGVTKSMVSYYE
nr:helix-turn-helix domain-containing protein [Clostridia bacterium]